MKGRAREIGKGKEAGKREERKGKGGRFPKPRVLGFWLIPA